MNTLRATFFSLLIFASGSISAKPATRHFADGLKIAATLETGEGNPQLTVVRYDDEWREQQLLYGELTSEGEGKFRLEYKWADDADKEHTRTATVSVAGGKLSYSGLKETGGTPDVPLSGGPWKEVTAPAVLRNAKARHEAADKLLNAAWKQAREEVGEAGFPKMRDAQREWLEYRDDIVSRVALQAAQLSGGEEEESENTDYESLPAYWNQMTSQTADRTPVIRAWSGKSVTPGRSGIYTDSYGGEVTLEEKDGGLYFEIDTVRTVAFNLGHVEGTAKVTGDTAAWTDAAKPQGDKPAVLNFKFNADRSLTIESENADSYHGARAHFDGTYYKVRSLKKDAARSP